MLVATGRRSNIAGLGLEKAGIEMTERGAVKVDGQLRTTNPRVWAAGDVTGHPQFVYVAANEGNIAARNALEGAGAEVDITALPRVIFTQPAGTGGSTGCWRSGGRRGGRSSRAR